MSLSAIPMYVADITAAQDVIRAYVAPTVTMLAGLATLVCTFFIVLAGFQYITSRGSPDKLDHAKRVLRNALIGLVIVLAAGTLTAILSHAYGNTTPGGMQNIPPLETIEQPDQGLSVVDVLIKAIVGLFKYIIESAAAPFLAALDYFTHETPLLAQNAGVFRLWLGIVAIANALFVLMVALLGFHVMSASAIGLDEVDIKHLVPRLAITFLLLNTSIFILDAIIGLSNVMIKAVEALFASVNVWDVLSAITDTAGGMGLVALLIMVAFVVLAVILLVYYVMRIVTLYIGAVLSPLVMLLSLLPAFKDFAMTAFKTYLATIFVLFVHVVILQLAASLFASTIMAGEDAAPNPLMAMVVGIATLLALLRTQGVMMQMAYVSAGPRALRKLGEQFVNGASYTAGKFKAATAVKADTFKPNSRGYGYVSTQRPPNMTSNSRTRVREAPDMRSTKK